MYCGVEVARGDPDLDGGRKEPGLLRQPDPLVCQRSPDPGSGGLDLPLGKQKERSARLRILPVFVGLPERLLRLGELSKPEADLADLVEGSRRDPWVPTAELLAGAIGFVTRSLEVALELHHLDAVYPAHAGECGQRVRVAKLGRALGPLAGAVEVGDVAAGSDRVAVDDKGRVRIELAAERGDACLVEKRAALDELAFLDERVALTLDSADLQAAVTNATADLLSLLAGGERAVEIVLPKRPQSLV